jgi:hypothetical protein
MSGSKQKILELLAALREQKISFEVFRNEFNFLISKGILGSFKPIERGRVSEFIGYLDAYDPDAKPNSSFSERWKIASKRIKGERAYPQKQIIEESYALEQFLLGNETKTQGFWRFFGVR